MSPSILFSSSIIRDLWNCEASLYINTANPMPSKVCTQHLTLQSAFHIRRFSQLQVENSIFHLGWESAVANVKILFPICCWLNLQMLNPQMGSTLLCTSGPFQTGTIYYLYSMLTIHCSIDIPHGTARKKKNISPQNNLNARTVALSGRNEVLI